ncbi:MAG: CpaF family protein [Agathobacter sp.]|nr:CpaF family protein [Agathobacter sp.]
MEALCESLRKQVLERMDFSRELSNVELQELIAREMSCQKDVKQLTIQQRVFVEQRVFNSLRKLDVLQELLEDDEITEILVNGPNCIFYEKNGAFFEHPYHFASEEKLQDVIQQIVGRHNRVVNLTSPIVDTRLEDGSRVNIVLTPIAIDGSAISIRKFGRTPMHMQALIQLETLDEELSNFLKQIVVSRYNIFISGGTSSGKTTFLNALSAFIPTNERIITIEDSAELQLQQTPNLVRLETRNSNQEGVKAITARELIHTALRMRPDRIIVGECRGEETLDMLQAMNTGHDGSLSTGHGNSIGDMLSRIEMMVLMGNDLPLLAIRQQIAMGIDIMIHLERGKDQKRRVVEVSELLGICEGEFQLNPLYLYREGRFEKVGALHQTRKWELSKEATDEK